MSFRPTIWFFREEALDDRYAGVFDRAGYETYFIPVLQTEPVELPNEIPHVDAVAVTSARAVEAIKSWEDLADLKEARWFAIGPATTAALEELGIAPEAGAPGTASALANIIGRAGVQRLLFLAGDPHRDTLGRILKQSGVAVETRIVYRMRAVTPVLPETTETPDWAVFFSPRGVSIVLEHTDFDWGAVAKAAIGPVTAHAMEAAGWEPSAIADSPTPGALLDAIRTAEIDIH